MSTDARLSQLRAQAGRALDTPLQKLIADDPARAQDFGVRVGPIYANFARQRYDRAAIGVHVQAWRVLLDPSQPMEAQRVMVEGLRKVSARYAA